MRASHPQTSSELLLVHHAHQISTRCPLTFAKHASVWPGPIKAGRRRVLLVYTCCTLCQQSRRQPPPSLSPIRPPAAPSTSKSGDTCRRPTSPRSPQAVTTDFMLPHRHLMTFSPALIGALRGLQVGYQVASGRLQVGYQVASGRLQVGYHVASGRLQVGYQVASRHVTSRQVE